MGWEETWKERATQVPCLRRLPRGGLGKGDRENLKCRCQFLHIHWFLLKVEYCCWQKRRKFEVINIWKAEKSFLPSKPKGLVWASGFLSFSTIHSEISVLSTFILLAPFQGKEAPSNPSISDNVPILPRAIPTPPTVSTTIRLNLTRLLRSLGSTFLLLYEASIGKKLPMSCPQAHYPQRGQNLFMGVCGHM